MFDLRFAAVLLIVCAGCGDQRSTPTDHSLRDERGNTDYSLPDGQGNVVIDNLTLAIGETVEIHGVCLKNDDFSTDFGAATIQVLRIDGTPTQEKIKFHLQANTAKRSPTYGQLQQLKPGRHYLVRGKLLNARINRVNNACSLRVEHFKEVEASKLTIGDFVDREATFDGLAAPNGVFRCDDESARLDGVDRWPEQIDGKQVSVTGTVRKDDRGLSFERPTWKLYRLNDLLNQVVTLDGIIASMNGECWFEYRGEQIVLTSASGPVLRFSPQDQHQPARVKGKLALQDRPSLNQIAMKEDRDLVPTYVIRDANVEFIGAQLSWEQKHDPLYASHHRSSNGVIELLPEYGFRRNMFGTESRAMLFVERNAQAIQEIVRELNSEHRDELARRMADESIDGALRLIYGAILASVNDDRGRMYLLKAIEIRDRHIDANALYCLGAFPFVSSHNNDAVDLAWAEEPLIDMMRNHDSVTVDGLVLDELKRHEKVPVASAAVIYSTIPAVMRRIGSDDCRSALQDFASTRAIGRDQVAQELCRWKPPLVADELLQLDSLVDDHSVHRMVLRVLLWQKAVGVVDRFEKDLSESFVYMDFRDQLSPEIVAQLQARMNRFKGPAHMHAQMLVALGQDDPVAELVKRVRDPSWTDKNLVFFELARLGDPRAIAPIARFLHDAPKDAVKDDRSLYATNTVSHALQAIAHAGTAEAIRELIELLPVDLSRFGGYIERPGWQRVVAAHLIELTGESFGTDVEKWRRWQRAHPDYSVPRELANPAAYFRSGPGADLDFGQ